MKKLLLFALLLIGFSPGAWSQVTDLCSGSALTGNWTQTSAAGFTAITCSSGTATVANPLKGNATYTGSSFTNDQYIQATVVNNSDFLGIGVHTNTSASGVFYFASLGDIFLLTNGAGSGLFAGCAAAVAGDVIKLSVQGNLYTAYLNGVACASGSDSTYTTGRPGIHVDNGNNLSAGLTTFSAGNFVPPLATPTFTPGSQAFLGTISVTINLPGGSTGCYTTDGTNPTATTPGTCSHGTTYSSAISLSVTTTVKAIATQVGQINSSIASATYTLHTPITWYVDAINGGPRYSAAAVAGGVLNSCNGSAATAFNPSGGNNQNCPYVDFRLLWDDPYTTAAAAWVILGGDTVIVSGCEQSTGNTCEVAGAPGTTSIGDYCFGLGPSCASPDFPSGSSSAHTRILGKLCQTSCSAVDSNWAGNGISGNKPDPAKVEYIFGAGNAPYGLAWQTTQYLDIQGFDLSDHAECGNIYIIGPQCDLNGATGMGIFAGNQTLATSDHILLQDVNIHGFISRGIRGNCGGLWTFNRVEIANNGGGGVDFDPGSGQLSTNCDFEGSYVGIDGNGCVEQYPITTATPWAVNGCTDDLSGGYGDGWGTAISPAVRFACDHCRGNNNTQDAYDIGHWSGMTISFTNTTCAGNMGGCFKIGAPTTDTFTNNIHGLNCRRLAEAYPGAPTGYNNHLGDFCRAGEGSGYNISTTSILYQSTPGGAYGITSSGTTVTGNGLFLTGTLPPHIGDYVTTDSVCGNGSPTSSWIRQVVTIPTETTLTINSAFPANLTCGSEHLIKLASSSGSTSSAVITATNNVYMGYEGTILGNQCQTGYPQVGVDGQQCTGYQYIFKNNIILGFGNVNYLGGNQPTMWADLAATTWENNNYFQLNSCSPCSGTGTVASSPLFNSQPASPISVESTLDNFNYQLTSSSPGRSAGTTPCPTLDINGNVQTSPCTMGVLVFGSTTPTTTTLRGITVYRNARIP